MFWSYKLQPYIEQIDTIVFHYFLSISWSPYGLKTFCDFASFVILPLKKLNNQKCFKIINKSTKYISLWFYFFPFTFSNICIPSQDLLFSFSKSHQVHRSLLAWSHTSCNRGSYWIIIVFSMYEPCGVGDPYASFTLLVIPQLCKAMSKVAWKDRILWVKLRIL